MRRETAENGSSWQSLKGFWLIAPEWNICQLFVFPDKLEAQETLRGHSGEDSACARTYIRAFHALHQTAYIYLQRERDYFKQDFFFCRALEVFMP